MRNKSDSPLFAYRHEVGTEAFIQLVVVRSDARGEQPGHEVGLRKDDLRVERRQQLTSGMASVAVKMQGPNDTGSA